MTLGKLLLGVLLTVLTCDLQAATHWQQPHHGGEVDVGQRARTFRPARLNVRLGEDPTEETPAGLPEQYGEEFEATLLAVGKSVTHLRELIDILDQAKVRYDVICRPRNGMQPAPACLYVRTSRDGRYVNIHFKLQPRKHDQEKLPELPERSSDEFESKLLAVCKSVTDARKLLTVLHKENVGYIFKNDPGNRWMPAEKRIYVILAGVQRHAVISFDKHSREITGVRVIQSFI